LTGMEVVTASMDQKRATRATRKGRAVHARTKSLADAKAGKPGDGKQVARWRTGPNGGEEQTTNGVRTSGRGGDGTPPATSRVSRKSTRGSWPAGEKWSAPLQWRAERVASAPAARAVRGK